MSSKITGRRRAMVILESFSPSCRHAQHAPNFVVNHLSLLLECLLPLCFTELTGKSWEHYLPAVVTALFPFCWKMILWDDD